MIRATPLFLFSFLCAAFPHDARAHANNPAAEAITAIEDGWLAHTTFGVVGTHFEGFVCEEAFLGGNAFHIVFLGPDEWVTMSENGLWTTSDGCDFTKRADLPVNPTDAAGHAASGRVAYVLNGDNGAGVYVSTDRGLTFERKLERAEHQWTGVRFADENTLVLSAYDRANAGAARLVRFDLSTEQATDLAMAGTYTYPYLLDAVGDRVLWLARAETQSLMFGPLDQPDTKVEPISSWPTAARIIADDKIAVAGMQLSRGIAEGVLVGTDWGWSELVPTTSALCLTPIGDDYLICTQRQFDDADIVRVRAGQGQTERLFTELTGPRDCPADSAAGAVCPVVWRELSRALGEEPEGPTDAGGDGSDAGADVGITDTPDIGLDASTPSDDPADTSEGCSAAGAGAWWLSLFALLGFRRKRT